MTVVVFHVNGIPLQFLRPPKPSLANFPTRNPTSLSYSPSTQGETRQQDNFKNDERKTSSSERPSSRNQQSNPALAEHGMENKTIDTSSTIRMPGSRSPIPPLSASVRLTGKPLSSAIEKEYSPERLLHLVATYKEVLTPVQICTAFHRIGKRGSKLGQSRKASLRKDKNMIWLAARVDECLPLYKAQALTNVAW